MGSVGGLLDKTDWLRDMYEFMCIDPKFSWRSKYSIVQDSKHKRWATWLVTGLPSLYIHLKLQLLELENGWKLPLWDVQYMTPFFSLSCSGLFWEACIPYGIRTAKCWDLRHCIVWCMGTFSFVITCLLFYVCSGLNHDNVDVIEQTSISCIAGIYIWTYIPCWKLKHKSTSCRILGMTGSHPHCVNPAHISK